MRGLIAAALQPEGVSSTVTVKSGGEKAGPGAGDGMHERFRARFSEDAKAAAVVVGLESAAES